MIKICSKCEIKKNTKEFYKDKSRKDGLRSECKKCTHEYKKEFYIRNKEQIKNYCEQNKDKKRDYDKEYREKNKEKRKEYCEINKEKMKEYNKNYQKQNRDKINKQKKDYNKEYAKQRRKNDIFYKLRNNISRSISFYLSKNNVSKNNCSFFKYLPYTIQQLKESLEKQFEPWMNWENHGNYKRDGVKTWQIDHIIPQSLLPYDSMEHPNFQKCWALENLRPLDSLENIRKGNKI